MRSIIGAISAAKIALLASTTVASRCLAKRQPGFDRRGGPQMVRVRAIERPANVSGTPSARKHAHRGAVIGVHLHKSHVEEQSSDGSSKMKGHRCDSAARGATDGLSVLRRGRAPWCQSAYPEHSRTLSSRIARTVSCQP